MLFYVQLDQRLINLLYARVILRLRENVLFYVSVRSMFRKSGVLPRDYTLEREFVFFFFIVRSRFNKYVVCLRDCVLVRGNVCFFYV